MAAAAGLTSALFRIKASSGTSSKQRKRIRRPQNVDGEFFVDNTCIDCDTCRWMAPETFNRQGHMSAVFKQPICEEERLKALQALLSCPTNSIHTEQSPRDILDVHKTFPIPVDEQRIPGVYHCGFHSEKSFGAASYLLVRPEGNILIDSPSYKVRLANNIKKLGGAKFMFLTHKDDVADHEKWSKELGCQRILHSEDVTHGTSDVEIKLEGNGPWNIDNDITLIHTPGHTEGSVCLLDNKRKVLFSGDHIFASQEEEDKLTISERYNFFSVLVQLQSVAKLIEVDFEWILPGHGRRAVFKDTKDKNVALQALLDAKGVQF